MTKDNYYNPKFNDPYDNIFGIKLNLGKNKDTTKNIIGGTKKEKKDKKSFSEIASNVAGVIGSGVKIVKSLKTPDDSVTVTTAENFAISTPESRAGANKKNYTPYIIIGIVVFAFIVVIVSSTKKS